MPRLPTKGESAMADATRSRLLRVLSGPQRGAELPLVTGTYAIGSGDDDAVILVDPKVAVHHATLVVTADGVRCVPEGGRVRLERNEVPGAGVALRPFQLFGLGETFLAIGPKDEPWPEIALPGLPLAPAAPPATAEQGLPAKPITGEKGAGTRPPASTSAPGAAPSQAITAEGAPPTPSRWPSAGLLFLLFGLVNAVAVGSIVWLMRLNRIDSDMASVDPVARVTDRIREFSELALLTESGQRLQVEGTLVSELRRHALLDQLRRLGIHVVSPEGTPVVRVDGRLRVKETAKDLTESLERMAELDVQDADGILRITGSLLADSERRGLIEALKRVPTLRVRPHAQAGYLAITGSFDRSDLDGVQKRLWRLGLTTVLVKADGHIRVEGYCRTRDRRMELERRLTEVAPPDSPRISWTFRNMEDLLTAAQNTRTEKSLDRVEVEEGGLGQILIDPPAEPIALKAWDDLIGALQSDPRILDVRTTATPASPPPVTAAGTRPVEKPVEIRAQPAAEPPAPRPTARLLPPIRSLHVGATQTVTLRDGRRLFLGAPVGHGFRLSAITSDSVVLRDDNGRREEIRVADDVVAENEDKDGPSGEEP
jgi:type III secretion system YscD/HrpQ family protein